MPSVDIGREPGESGGSFYVSRVAVEVARVRDVASYDDDMLKKGFVRDPAGSCGYVAAPDELSELKAPLK